MFLFIQNNIFDYFPCRYLNTSHVLIYRCTLLPLVALQGTFKYISCSYLSMLTSEQGMQKYKFKYISCSYLSKTTLCTTLEKLHLNTSHVLIYQKRIYTDISVLINLNTSHVLIYPVVRIDCHPLC